MEINRERARERERWMKSVKCLAYCRNEHPSFRGTQKSIFTMERRPPLAAPSGGKLDEHTQAVEREGGRHGNTSYSR